MINIRIEQNTHPIFVLSIGNNSGLIWKQCLNHQFNNFIKARLAKCFLTFKLFIIMNALKNKVQLIGNIGQNPEIKTFDSGNKMARLSLVTNEKKKNQSGELVNEATWHNLTVWGKTADIVEKFVEKGREIAIEGKLVNKSYTDKNGDKKYVTEIHVTELMLLGNKK